MRVADFNDKVRSAFVELGLDFSEPHIIGAAVSGGADSIALLTALKSLVSENFVVKTVTVNHNIREAEETCGDADYVESYCRKIGVFCERKELPRGRVIEVAAERNQGIEDAARFLRYREFEDFIRENEIEYLCLAHNRNDQEETVLMRFLSGGDCGALSGIQKCRGKFFRPLLDISRSEIEEYLVNQNISYRTDSTNFDTSLTRNALRRKVIPFLDEEMGGWKTALVSLERKMKQDSDFINDFALKVFEVAVTERGADKISFKFHVLSGQSEAVLRRIFYEALGSVGASSRVPYAFIERIISNIKSDRKSWQENSSGINVTAGDKLIFVQKTLREATEQGFFVIIERNGVYEFDDFSLEISEWSEFRVSGVKIFLKKKSFMPGSGKCEREIFIGNIGFPFIIRSRQTGDCVKGSSGKTKSLTKIFEEWKCGRLRDCIPLVQELKTGEQKIIYVWGEPFGFSDWISKEII